MHRVQRVFNFRITLYARCHFYFQIINTKCRFSKEKKKKSKNPNVLEGKRQETSKRGRIYFGERTKLRGPPNFALRACRLHGFKGQRTRSRGRTRKRPRGIDRGTGQKFARGSAPFRKGESTKCERGWRKMERRTERRGREGGRKDSLALGRHAIAARCDATRR